MVREGLRERSPRVSSLTQSTSTCMYVQLRLGQIRRASSSHLPHGHLIGNATCGQGYSDRLPCFVFDHIGPQRRCESFYSSREKQERTDKCFAHRPSISSGVCDNDVKVSLITSCLLFGCFAQRTTFVLLHVSVIHRARG